MLHMQHVVDLHPGPYPGVMRSLVNHNPVFDEVRTRGYAVVSNAVAWSVVDIRESDYRCGDGPMTEFEFHLLRNSLIMIPARFFEPDLLADRHRAFTQGAFDCAVRAANSSVNAPLFVMSHVGAPHLPIVFGVDGNPADLRYYSDTFQELDVPADEIAAAYTRQVEYLNSQILSAVDRILDRNPDAVILVMSDHGSESRLDWLNARRSDFDERFSNLFAARTPGYPELFGEDPTAVNTLTRVLNAYLGADHPEASDTLYYSDPGIVLNLVELNSIR
jgi:hypothetical protein